MFCITCLWVILVSPTQGSLPERDLSLQQDQWELQDLAQMSIQASFDADLADEIEIPFDDDTMQLRDLERVYGTSTKDWDGESHAAGLILKKIGNIVNMTRPDQISRILSSVHGVLREHKMKYIATAGKADTILFGDLKNLEGNCYTFVEVMAMVSQHLGVQDMIKVKAGERITDDVYGLVADLEGSKPIDPAYFGSIAVPSEQGQFKVANKAYFQSHTWLRDASPDGKDLRYDPTTGMSWAGPHTFTLIRDVSECTQATEEQIEKNTAPSRLCNKFHWSEEDGTRNTITRVEKADYKKELPILGRGDGSATVALESSKGSKYIKLAGRGWNLYQLDQEV